MMKTVLKKLRWMMAESSVASKRDQERSEADEFIGQAEEFLDAFIAELDDVEQEETS